MTNLLPFRLVPEYRDYVWGGRRLRPDQPRTAEAWIVSELDRIQDGPYADWTLAETAERLGAELLGSVPFQRTGSRFPLLIKLLDCADWLSLQVHPNDEQAVKLEGEGQFGKTEAWHILNTEPGASLLCGLRPGTSSEQLAEAIRQGKIVEYMERLEVQKGDSVFIRAGTIHALGPGLLLYEVQQTSNLTYRVYDWDRPATPERPLHIDKSLAVADPTASGKAVPLPGLKDGQPVEIAKCEYFTLKVLAAQERTTFLSPAGLSFHALTIIEGEAVVEGPGWSQKLGLYETLLIPASIPAYRIEPRGAYKALAAHV